MPRANVPVWLLDIDGVINATYRGTEPPTQVWRRDQWKTTRVNGWQIHVAQPVVDFITEVWEKRRAEIRWHTTWQDEANKLGAALGLPHFWVQESTNEFENQGDYLLRGQWWKLPAVWRVKNLEKRSVIWTDDEIVDLSRAQQDSLLVGGKALLIAPTASYGLTKRQLARIGEFVGLN